MKECSKCFIAQSLSEFSKASNTKDGLNYWCKTCYKDYNKVNTLRRKEVNHNYYINNKENIDRKIKEYQEVNKEMLERYYKNYRYINRVKINKRVKQYRMGNKEKVKAYRKLHKSRNKGLYAKYQATRRANKLLQTPILTKNENDRLTIMYKITRYMKDKFNVILHVDHIVPLSKGGLHHPINLQIITEKDNFKKGNTQPSKLSPDNIKLHSDYYGTTDNWALEITEGKE